MTRTAAVFIAGIMLLSGAASPALAQGGDEIESFSVAAQAVRHGKVGTFQLCSGQETVTPEKLLAQYASITGKRFIYNPTVFRGCAMELKGAGRTTFENSQADRVFQGVLRNNGLALVPLAEVGLETYSVEQIASSHILKSHARPIAFENVAEAMERPAEVFVTAIPLTHVPVSQVRQAVQNFITSRTAEFIQETSGSNSLIVCGFGPTVANVAMIVGMLDQKTSGPKRRSGRVGGTRSGSTKPPRGTRHGTTARTGPLSGSTKPPRVRRSGSLRPPAGKKKPQGSSASRVTLIVLENASASANLARTISNSLGSSLRVLPDARTNSMILLGTEKDIEQARDLLALFDRPAKKNL